MWALARLLPSISYVSNLPEDVRPEGPNSRYDKGKLVGKGPMQTDPIADLLTCVRNALRARKETVSVPRSRVKEAIVKILIEEGFLHNYRIIEQRGFPYLSIELKYNELGEPALHGLQRVSKPSLRTYVRADAIPAVRNGLGVNILSTSKGVVADREARKRHIGGEVLCSVW